MHYVNKTGGVDKDIHHSGFIHKFTVKWEKCNHLLQPFMQCAMCKTNRSVNSFSMVDFGNNDLAINIKEALHIKLKRPTLSKQLYNFGTSFV